MSNFTAYGGLGKRLPEAFGIRTEESDAEVDRATRRAQSEHGAALEARRADFELLRSRVEATPTFVLKLAPNEAMYSCIYKPAIMRLSDGREVDGAYGMAAPAERLDQAVFDVETRAIIAQHVTVRAPNSGRSQIPEVQAPAGGLHDRPGPAGERSRGPAAPGKQACQAGSPEPDPRPHLQRAAPARPRPALCLLVWLHVV